ncbi:hypothetical protein [Nocardioides ferulae]|uniref:hypothetical protein n=1 Tax=Nocardioides ferulae TaxID=2340821 RepID=UPI000EABCB58|nr:hypothetical protein [Nocardioides ferulae]
MRPAPDPPPYLDEHHLLVDAPRERVWAALETYAAQRLRVGGPVARVLGTHPPAGFAPTIVDPGERLELSGRHRFSRYRLTWLLADSPGGTELRAVSHAEFPGVHGRVYRWLVVRTGLHALVTRRLVREVGRRALEEGTG